MKKMRAINTDTTISGKGDADSRLNEITGDNLAVFRDFAAGYTYGIVRYDGHDFGYSVNKNTITITDGICFAYGYFGYCKSKSFDILPPATENYFIVYVRINKSVVPNTIQLLIKNNYASSMVGKYSFRQDVLSTVKTGIFEIPLWIFKATGSGIDKDSFKTLKQPQKEILKSKIKKTEYSDFTNIVLKDGNLQNGVTAVTQAITDKSKKIATTEFTDAAIQAEINR